MTPQTLQDPSLEEERVLDPASAAARAEAEWDAADAEREASAAAAILKRRNRRFLGILAVVGLGMLGFAYANVPLYSMVCDALGIGYNPNSAQLAGADEATDRTIEVLFMGNVTGTLPIRFQPLQTRVRSTLGEMTMTDYRFINTSNRTVYFRAIHSIVPTHAASDEMFKLSECFCFTAQRLHPGQSVTVPVVFSFSPRLREGTNTVTISYTLMPLTREAYEQEMANGFNESGVHSQINPPERD